jgi:hypothetical protein
MALACLLCLTLLAVAQAAPVSFTVALTGAEQVPPVTTSATGSAALTYDAATGALTWSITYSGLSGPATMAHIHGPAPAGKNAGVLIWLAKKGEPVASPIKGQVTLTAQQGQELLAGNWYINIHTTKNPGGEIRGQLNPPKS